MTTTFDHAGLKDLVYRTAGRFCRAKGLYADEYDDALQDAFVAAVEADKTYDEARGAKRSTWVAWKVQKQLLEQARQVAKRKKNLPAVSLDAVQDDDADRKKSGGPETRDVRPFEVADLLYDLRADAALVVRLVLDTPLDLWESKDGKRPQPGVVRKRLAAVLEGLGWCRNRSRKAFSEIMEVLSS
jgi:DNA-directed RNA polymerase specialized sigma24 family protein